MWIYSPQSHALPGDGRGQRVPNPATPAQDQVRH